MTISYSALEEPRGLIRIFQLVFSLCALATTCGYSNSVNLFYCPNKPDQAALSYSYPFRLSEITTELNCNKTMKLSLYGDFSSDCQFFVATGVLSFLYCVGIVGFYLLNDIVYLKHPIFPKIDFGITVIIAIFWLSGSAAWANGLSGLKSITDSSSIQNMDACRALSCTHIYSGSFSMVNISVILGFLNFFLWASNLWFIYKETMWYKEAQTVQPSRSATLS